MPNQANRTSIGVSRRWLIAAAAICAVAVAAVAVVVVASAWSGGGDDRLSAVIIDQLAVTDANPEFVQSATESLEAAGYEVDYVPPHLVTVDLYRYLPSGDYDLIILRSHSSDELFIGARDAATGQTTRRAINTVQLFTNEPYAANAHFVDQQRFALSKMTYDTGDDSVYFGITPQFVTDVMEGDLDGAVILLMGCAGLSVPDMADAFLDRGVESFVSWDGLVSAAHTDEASLSFIDAFVSNRHDAGAAVRSAIDANGKDPSFGSQLALRERP